MSDPRHMSIFELPSGDLPKADCANCKFDALNHPGAHCYMFVEKPLGDRCGQFKPKVK
jgi:hypothetical protein